MWFAKVLVEVGCQPPKLPSAKSTDQGRGSELILCSSHLCHVPGNALAQGLRAENPHHTLKMQQGNSLEERGMRHRLQKQRQAKRKAKNKWLWMHWAWPVIPITWFFWLFSIFKTASQGGWLGYRSHARCPMLPALPTSPWDLTCWVYLGDEPKTSWSTLCCSAGTGKTPSGSHKNLGKQKRPPKPVPSNLFGPQVTAGRHLGVSRVLCHVLL